MFAFCRAEKKVTNSHTNEPQLITGGKKDFSVNSANQIFTLLFKSCQAQPSQRAIIYYGENFLCAVMKRRRTTIIEAWRFTVSTLGQDSVKSLLLESILACFRLNLRYYCVFFGLPVADVVTLVVLPAVLLLGKVFVVTPAVVLHFVRGLDVVGCYYRVEVITLKNIVINYMRFSDIAEKVFFYSIPLTGEFLISLFIQNMTLATNRRPLSRLKSNWRQIAGTQYSCQRLDLLSQLQTITKLLTHMPKKKQFTWKKKLTICLQQKLQSENLRFPVGAGFAVYSYNSIGVLFQKLGSLASHNRAFIYAYPC